MAKSSKSSKSTRKLSPARFAPVGLILSGLGLLAGIVFLVIKLLTFIGMYTPTNAKAISTGLLISVGVIVIGLAVYALLDPRKTRDFLSGRQARHGSNAIIMLLAFVLILVVINVIVYQNPWQKDLTESQQNTLSPETIKALKALPAPVHAIGFFSTRISNTSTQTLFSNIKSKSDGKFTYQFINPDTNPTLARQYKVAQDGTIVLVMNDQTRLYTTDDEQGFTDALVKLMNPGERTVYFLTGHGEHDITTSGDTAYTDAKAVLESKNYTVKTLNLLAENKVPTDALAIIINGPTKPLEASEVTLLQKYVDGGGSLVVLEEPKFLTEGATPTTDPLEDYLASDWNIKIENDMIMDPSTSYGSLAVAYSYGTHAITDGIKTQYTIFPDASSLTLTSTNANVTTTSLVQTAENAWGETNFAQLSGSNPAPTYDAGQDVKGPLTIAAAATSTKGGRVVVFGDSDFADDTYFTKYADADMFVNSVDWAAGQENMINLTQKQSAQRTMKPITNLTFLLLAFAFVILIPGLIIAGGIASWVMRRRRG